MAHTTANKANRKNKKIAARIVFFLGLLLMSLGSAFLFGTLTDISKLSVFASFSCVIVGALCAFYASRLNVRPSYRFFAAFFLLIGIFLFLSALNVIPLHLRQSWPLLSVFAGLALVPAGFRRYGGVRTRYLVPALAFVILGCVLLIFSLKIAPFSFKRFISGWWPFLVLLAGVLLVLLSAGPKGGGEAPKL